MTFEFEEIREPQRLYPEDVQMYDLVLCRVMSILLDRPATIPPQETIALTGALHRLRITLSELADAGTQSAPQQCTSPRPSTE